MQIVIYVKRRVLDWRRDTEEPGNRVEVTTMQTTFQRGSFITRRIHPLAVRFQTGESGIDQAIRQSQRIAFDGEIAINTPIFLPPQPALFAAKL